MPHNDTAFVFIIESPSHKDLLNGRTEGRALSESLTLSNIKGWYSMASSLEMLKQALTARLSQAIQQFPNMSPIIHFSMHGNSNGIELTSGEFLTWENLRQELIPLNNAMNGGLLICMSTCNGVSGIRMAMNEDNDKPFWTLVGNSKATDWGDAAVAYVMFYHQLFKGESPESAVNAMKIASGDNDFTLHRGHKIKNDWASHMAETCKNKPLNAFNAFLSTNN